MDKIAEAKEKFGKISFLGPEINIIHPVNQSFDFSFNPTTVSSDGVFSGYSG